MTPSFTDSFKDPRFIITLALLVASAGAGWFRLGLVEQGLIEAKHERSKYGDRIGSVERMQSLPRYTLEEDEKRMNAFDLRIQKERDYDKLELSRIQLWIEEQNRFRLQMVEFAARTEAATNEMRGLIKDLKNK